MLILVFWVVRRIYRQETLKYWLVEFDAMLFFWNFPRCKNTDNVKRQTRASASTVLPVNQQDCYSLKNPVQRLSFSNNQLFKDFFEVVGVVFVYFRIYFTHVLDGDGVVIYFFDYGHDQRFHLF